MPKKLKTSFFFEGRDRDHELISMIESLCRSAENVATDPRKRETLEELCQMIFAKSSWASPKVNFGDAVISCAFRAALLLDSTDLVEQGFPIAFSSAANLASVLTMAERCGMMWLQRRYPRTLSTLAFTITTVRDPANSAKAWIFKSRRLRNSPCDMIQFGKSPQRKIMIA